MEDLVGITLGGYTLLHPLGNGGMGSVYLAQDPTIGQSVAVKVVQNDNSTITASDSMTYGQVEDRFRQEARAVASLDHLHILPLYRYGEEETSVGKRAYMVMQYRPEGSLGDWFKARASGEQQMKPAMVIRPAPADKSSLYDDGSTSEATSLYPSSYPADLPMQWPLALQETALYVQQAASALQHAHDHGLVHRDVKPANFLLRFDHDVLEQQARAFLLLSDFGLVKSLSSQVTPKSILGTPMYMAPEQFSGNASPASDQYALAVMTYLMLTGRHPFNGEPIHLMHQHLTSAPPSPRRYCSSLPLATEQILLRALAKEPEQRYPSIAAFSEAFIASCSAKEIPRRVFFLMNLFAQKTGRRMVRIMRTREQTVSEGQASGLPNAFEATIVRASTEKAVVRSVTDEVDRVPNEASVTGEQTMQQGEWRGVSTTHPLTGEEQEPTVSVSDTSSEGKRVDFPTGGSQVATAEADRDMSRRGALAWIGGVVIVAGASIATGALLYRNVSHAQVAQSSASPVRTVLLGHQAAITALAWSSDGARLASGSRDRSIRVWPLRNMHSPLVIDPQMLAITALAWNPHHDQLAASGMAGEIVLLDASAASIQAKNEQVFPLAGTISSLAWNSAGSMLFAGTLRAGLHTLMLSSGQMQQLGSAKAGIRSMMFASNQQLLAFGTQLGTVAVLDLSTQKWLFRQRLHTGAVTALAWSSDGTQLASGGPDQLLQIVDAHTWELKATFQQVSAINGIAWKPGISPLLVTALADATICLYNVATSTSQIYQGHSGPVTAIAWSSGGLATGSSDKSVIIWDL